ncbi:heavy-metal-associated domain-containing protein [Aquibacillus rhizosphaerae]|uniref:HMA domain-containing protein n=1 Tax=Aquibacillus rhizosphaerae TaxID=3051431 RepID=A0ABT7L3D6_9BACI|nr:hypothetical protein [Aquibacillus sp. LR5S19]MDL4840377.1 hypothetical protein [Aquibacillus sp. LR5S19]
MNEATIFVKEVTGSKQIQQIEQILNKMDGVERVLIDTDDGEVKVGFDEQKVSKEEIIINLEQNNYYV